MDETKAERSTWWSRDDYVPGWGGEIDGRLDEMCAGPEGLDERQRMEIAAELAEQDLECELEWLQGADALEDADGFVAHGTQRRWDGTSGGFTEVYDSIADIVHDTGQDGIFRDCELDEIWSEGGDLHVRGVHHDGSVTLAVRALDAAAREDWEEAEWEDDPVARVRDIWDTRAVPCAA